MPFRGPCSRSFRMVLVACGLLCGSVAAQDVPPGNVEGQPLASNVNRLLETLASLGAPFDAELNEALIEPLRAEDPIALQRILDRQVLFVVSVNPELRVSVRRGPADAALQQFGFTPCLIKVLNDATVTRTLRLSSPQAGPNYAGASEPILARQAQTELKINENTDRVHRFLDLEVMDRAPMSARLSGLPVEYLLVLISSGESGQREATVVFDIGQGTQDLGFRSEVPVLFEIRPAVPVRLAVHDFDGQPTTARLEIRDRDGRVFPPQARRLAPDFFFQPQIYRAHDDTVLLPPGDFELEYSRGPEYRRQTRAISVSPDHDNVIEITLERWINPADYGYFSGDHHIHGAGCSHYDNPTQGVTPQDMFAQVQGEGLNVGCVLTWGPCYEHQRTFFSPIADTVSTRQTILKYDLEISGFGSAALGHVCLLNLSNQTYPGSEGSKTQGWPSWTVPVMRWAKEQGGVTGYPHSAMHVDPVGCAQRLTFLYDQNHDGQVSGDEARGRLLPAPFDIIDGDGNGAVTVEELTQAADRVADQLPNVALPGMDGGGAMEIFVSTASGVCDFISAMDTARIPEWNTWYHLMNCGFPLKLSGETDFPCMSSRRVGQGRVYVQLGEVDHVDFPTWCRGIAAGQAYVSDGYAHAFHFEVEGHSPGHAPLGIETSRVVTITAQVAFAPEHPRAVAYGTLMPPTGPRMSGDTVNLHAPRDSGFEMGGDRRVELVVNGRPVADAIVPADGQIHAVAFEVPIAQSSWVALRQFPQLHTNPVNVLVAGEPIRASRASALWCAESTRLLWTNRSRFIQESERPAARAAYESALETFQRIASHCPPEDGLEVLPVSLEAE